MQNWKWNIKEMWIQYKGEADGQTARRVWRGVEELISMVLGDDYPDVVRYRHPSPYDLWHEYEEKKYEVKSSQTGYFVLRREQHERIKEEGARYVFVRVGDRDGWKWTIEEYAVVEPGGVQVPEWTPHHDRDYEYAYIPVDELMEVRGYTHDRWSRGV
jgi:hypothetical protein